MQAITASSMSSFTVACHLFSYFPSFLSTFPSLASFSLVRLHPLRLLPICLWLIQIQHNILIFLKSVSLSGSPLIIFSSYPHHFCIFTILPLHHPQIHILPPSFSSLNTIVQPLSNHDLTRHAQPARSRERRHHARHHHLHERGHDGDAAVPAQQHHARAGCRGGIG